METEERSLAGYVEGKDAGSVTLNGASLVLDGTVKGGVRIGDYQRESGINTPIGGQLILGDASGGGRTEDPSYRLPKTEIRGVVDSFVPDAGQTWLNTGLSDRGTTTLLSADLFAHGVSRFALYSNGAIDQKVAIDVGPGGTVSLLGSSVNVGNDINAPGGTIDIVSHKTGKVVADGSSLKAVVEIGGNVTVAQDSVLNVAGRWTNDLKDGATALVVNRGGSINLDSAQDLLLSQGSVLDASAGAWLKGDGKLTQGGAGSITLRAAQSNNRDGKLDLAGATLQARGFSKGGKLILAAPNLSIGGLAGSGLGLGADFFAKGGFGAFDLTGIGSATLVAGTQLTLQAEGLIFAEDYRERGGSASIAQSTEVAVIPQESRLAADFTMRAAVGGASDSGSLKVETGAAIVTGTLGKIALEAAHDLWVDGTLSATAGSIALSLSSGAGSFQDAADLGKRSIWLGDNARLLATGAVKPEFSTAGLRKGEVLAGGTVSLDASKLGYVVTGSGSIVDVSGTSAVFDITNQKVRSNVVNPAMTVAGNAGSITVAARQGAFVDGTMKAASGGIGAAAGSFTMKVDGLPNESDVVNALAGYPKVGGYELRVAVGGSVLPAGISRAAGIAGTNLGHGAVSAQGLQDAGFDDITLSSQNTIAFDAGANLGPRRSLVLEAPRLTAAGPTTVAAEYLKWSNGRQTLSTTTDGGGVASSGNGRINFTAGLLDLVGDLVLGNIGQASFSTDSDIRFQSAYFNVNNLLQRTGRLDAAADLVFAADQLYPTTFSKFSVSTPGRAVTFTKGADAAELPLSANGSLTVEARDIVQGGVLRAPFGNISLKASNQLDLLAGSVTSVSGAGVTVPYGELQNGDQWIYPNPLGSGASEVLVAAPAKVVNLEAPTVKAAAGSVVDVSGGGDLFGSEFVPGVGGSRDYLASSNVFAILPGYDAAFAPVDPVYASGSTLKTGMQITIAAGAGLPAGTYTLLPARYGLLPGAFVVSSIGGYRDLAPTQTIAQADGSAIVGGRLGTAGTSILESRSNGFLVEPGSTFLKRSEYRAYGANDTFAARNVRDGTSYELPKDGGRLSFAASTALTQEGIIRLLAGAGGTASSAGRGGALEIAAPRIAVTDGTPYGAGFITLDLDTLRSIGPATLILGGRQGSSNGAGQTTLNVTASEIVIDADGSTLEMPELIAVATDRVFVGAGTTISGSGFGAAGNSLAIAGDGAALRVAGELGQRLVRTGSIGAIGDIEVKSRVTLKGGTVELDATRDHRVFNADAMSVTDRINVDASVVAVGARALRFGEDSVANRLNVGSNLLGQLGKASALSFRSYSDIAFASGYTLSGSGLASLTLDTPLIVSEGGSASVKATDVHLINTSAQTAGIASVGSGKFVVEAGNRVVVAPSEQGMAISGFGAVELKGKEIVAAGKGDLSIGMAGESTTLAIKAGQVTTATAADVGFRSRGALTVTQAGSAGSAPEGLGGRLRLAGTSVTQAGTINLPAGAVELQATSGDVVLAAGSVTRAGGVEKNFGGTSAFADAGRIVLTADGGNVVIAKASGQDAASLIDVAAQSGGGSGGEVEINAVNGQLTLGGNLAGQGGTNGLGGSFVADVKQITALDDVADALAGKGFTERLDLRVRSGSQSLSTGKVVQANQVALSVDGGALVVAGTVDASGNKGGEVRLFARDDVTLKSSAEILAKATGSGETAKGGKVSIGSTSGQLDLQSGSRVDVSSAEAEQHAVAKVGESAQDTATRLAKLAAERFRLGGEVTLRAERTGAGAGNEVKVSNAQSDFTGAAIVAVEGVKKYAATSIGAANIGTYTNDVTSFMVNAAAILSRLDPAGTSSIVVRPGVEIASTGDLALASDWNLYSASRAGGQPGVLTLRATSNLNLSKNLSDGFELASPGSNSDPKFNNLRPGESWSYRLIGGADQSAADPLRVTPLMKTGSTGDVVLASKAVVRTTTGNIEIAAGRDFKLTDSTAVIYTAGLPVEVVNGQTADGFAVRTQAPYGQISSTAINGTFYGAFPSRGGDIRIAAGRDAIGAADSQLGTHWLWRQGQSSSSTSTRPEAWWMRFDLFQQNVGALGGGSVDIMAGSNVTNLSAMLPSNGRTSQSGDLVVNASGDLSVHAGGDIRGGQFMVMGGLGRIWAGGSLKEGDKPPKGTSDSVFYPILHVADGQFSVSARADARIETVLNPTVLMQANSVYQGQTASSRSFFYTYTGDDRVSLTAVTGTAGLQGATRLQALFKNSQFPGSLPTSVVDDSGMEVLPANLGLTAFSGDVLVGRKRGDTDLVMFPSATSQLDLLAAGSVTMNVPLRLPDVDPAAIPSALNSAPQNRDGATRDSLGVKETGLLNSQGQLVSLHTGDDDPVRVVAVNGNVTGIDSGNVLFSAKPVQVSAGGDVTDFGFTAQNLDSTDVTSVIAGRDVRFSVPQSTENKPLANGASIQVGGGGLVYVESGRDTDLATSGGIVTTGNLTNPSLASSGAGVRVLAGAATKLDAGAFGSKYLGDQYQYIVALQTYLSSLGLPAPADADAARAAYAGLTGLQQEVFAGQVLAAEFVARYLGSGSPYLSAWTAHAAASGDNVTAPRFSTVKSFWSSLLWTELRGAGNDASAGGATPGNYERGFQALELLGFGNVFKHDGDLNLLFSQIKTRRDGAIELFVPGGNLNVGLASVGTLSKNADQLGIISEREGDVLVAAQGDILVNSSRIFSMGGSDMLLWTSAGDIDAGKGAKTAVILPDPVRNENNEWEFPAGGAGSGIAAIQGRPGVRKAKIVLVAPAGTVNAGDAGIQSSGDLTIAAVQVIGADNIRAGGAVTGVPAAPAASAPAVSVPTAASTEASQSVDQMAATAAGNKEKENRSILTVEVVGVGEESDEERKRRLN